MRHWQFALLLIGLMTAGCTSTRKETQPAVAKNTTSARVPGGQVPAHVAKLLPLDQIDANNAREQYELLNATVQRENGQFERTATARRN